ncbi:halocarboxylic acid dehydrogenase DehI family protein [Modicisalibacter luteus]|uniref:Halocarboxylic acid dehydrogenase DehI family protein n=1 Tax=Modicisalibacter luteus TaxID=453962 RepID=A0ABV7M5R0_9GAMM|nr:halocarboxylic acid dehydrogenase DehI family protein [Halomonas lutea]GHA88087.1 hypothetical protein GCM10007159_06870 [Halomonas lutea]
MVSEQLNQTIKALQRPERDVPVRPLPEHRVDAELAPTYQDLKATLGVPWVGVITQAVAHYRPFFVEAWRQFQPSARSHYFESCCDAIRLTAWEQAGDAFDIESRTGSLRQLGYSDTELAQIRATLDVFDYGNPKYLVLATAIQQSLCHGRKLGGDPAQNRRDSMPRAPIYQTDPIPTMIEEHHAVESLNAVYEDIKATLNLPFVNSDYKAMGRWPSYLALAWGDLKPSIDSDPYVRIRQLIHEQAIATAEKLPHTYFLDRTRAIQAGLSEEQTDELMQVISLFQWLLSGLILNVTHFKLAMREKTNK